VSVEPPGDKDDLATDMYTINRYIYVIKILDTARPCSEKDKTDLKLPGITDTSSESG